MFNNFGVTEEDQSPFYRIFLSITNLRDKFIPYLTKTFSSGDASGTAEPRNTNDEACDAPAASPEAVVLEQVRMFAEKILGDDSNSDEDIDGENIEAVSNCDDIQVVSPSQISITMAISSAELMTNFHKHVSSSMGDLINNVIHASSCLERNYRGRIKGAVRFFRKAKLLHQWVYPTTSQPATLPS